MYGVFMAFRQNPTELTINAHPGYTLVIKCFNCIDPKE